MVNLKLLEDRIDSYYRKIVNLEDELHEDHTKKQVTQIEDDIEYYEKLMEQAEKKYKKAGGKNLGGINDSLLLD
jgi:hypothetical protein